MSIEHLVWDWNGTLFGDGRALIESTIEAFAAAGMPPITRELYQRHHSQPIRGDPRSVGDPSDPALSGMIFIQQTSFSWPWTAQAA